MDKDERENLDWDQWWKSHGKIFKVYKDLDSARKVAEEFIDSEYGLVYGGAQENLLKLNEYQIKSDE